MSKKLNWTPMPDGSCRYLTVGSTKGRHWVLSIEPEADKDTHKQHYPWRGPYRVEVERAKKNGDVIKTYRDPYLFWHAGNARDAAWAMLRRAVERGDD